MKREKNSINISLQKYFSQGNFVASAGLRDTANI
jgi:hypothetical protein